MFVDLTSSSKFLKLSIIYPVAGIQLIELMLRHNALSLERRIDIGEAMWAASSRRQYLLKTKAKYAGITYIIIII